MNRPDLSSVDLDAFRTIMGSLTSGVSVVTGLDQEGNPCGMTSSAVCSVSADPPLLLTCVKPPSRTLDAIQARGCFVVNFLDAEGSEFSDLFASRTRDKFARVGWRPSEVVGAPLLDRTVAYAECTVHDRVEAGDHVIVLGRIVSGAVAPERFPLGYWRGRYVRVFRVASGVPRRSQDRQE
ncbi:flavin reductase family protein [Phytohabitans rumicis]|uniref:Flavin reductase like domain-containing protein n=1 Tax=Phytohabitans rumicis TaxID=1076125 RepID=A0A6V8L2X8_9ACTN|nr:flavin reductase family protein [Phytohabitans rumicis]GFJ91633.1 hypothetical protein Prum_052750 [Phytohabitans rumicis]